ncbi:GAF domain-containing protein [Adhaeribacter swui]|uniref:histidine kinase n=1 Tax=Adhaeribacter swui TaxID=2086471 RepID=A0A7G7GAX1_9BACT|nr:ATP-binding protein [Adhaeribacter swui]QNF34305.1 GAF domain-containing protein [Adhaeribacter swui]
MQNYKNHFVDLSNCDTEPIYIIGRIQPHGFLLVLDAVTHVIEQTSTNTADFLNFSPESLLNQPLADLLSNEEYQHLHDILLQEQPVNPQLLSWQGNLFFGFIHTSGNKIILEGEPYTTSSDLDRIKDNNRLVRLNEQLNVLDNLASVAQAVAKTLLEVLAYDRVEVIQYDSEWNSEVIAEARNNQLPAYLGHHFPASDIPAPARELLRQKHIRQIPDVHAPSVEIIPYYNPTTGAPTNIIKSELRNPSEIHLEYVHNMGVAATISFSVLVKGNLWGLISCHNVTPVFMDVWKRQTGELITKAFANNVSSIQEKRDKKQWARFRETEEQLIRQINSSKNIRAGLLKTEYNLLALTEGTGAIVALGNQVTNFGLVPTEEQVRALIDWLAENNTERLFCSRQLEKIFPEAAAYREVASGLLALEISRYNKEYLLFFKPEIKETRVWAGNPELPKLGADLRLHPRKSFEKWEEVIKGKSEGWSLNEQEITQTFLKDVVALQLRNQATQLENLNKELTQAADALQAKNDQLEDFAHIMSHNLRSPLSNITGLHQLYQDEPNLENAAFAIEHIKRVSDNMTQTIEDLNVILKTRINRQLPVEEVQLSEIIQKEQQNLLAIPGQAPVEWHVDLQVKTILLPKIYVESFLHNLMSNAIKYRSPERAPVVTIKSWLANERIYIAVSDNGLGMNLAKMGDKLFGLYKTFHRHENAKGLGLYLTKMQIEALGGTIEVASELNKGTTFTVSFNQTGD